MSIKVSDIQNIEEKIIELNTKKFIPEKPEIDNVILEEIYKLEKELDNDYEIKNGQDLIINDAYSEIKDVVEITDFSKIENKDTIEC